MARAKENVLSLLGSETIDLTAAGGTEVSLYTVPSAKIGIPVFVMLHSFNEAVDEAVVTGGITGGDCDEFVGDRTLTNVGAGFADETLKLEPIPNATPLAGLLIDAAESFGIEITTPETTGAATCIADLWGYERPV